MVSLMHYGVDAEETLKLELEGLIAVDDLDGTELIPVVWDLLLVNRADLALPYYVKLALSFETLEDYAFLFRR